MAIDVSPTGEGLCAHHADGHTAGVGLWHGMVFVNPDAGAGSLDDAVAGLDPYLGTFRPGELQEIATARIPLAANWKLFVENHIDVYHLWYLHERTLADFEHTRFEHHAVGPNWASYEPMRPGPAAGVNAVGDRIGHLDERDAAGIQAHLLFPNTLIAASTNYFATYAVHALSPTASWIDLRIRGEAHADAPTLLDATRAFIDEDVRACEQVQMAMSSRHFAVGPLARTHERPIASFHANLLAHRPVAHLVS